MHTPPPQYHNSRATPYFDLHRLLSIFTQKFLYEISRSVYLNGNLELRISHNIISIFLDLGVSL